MTYADRYAYQDTWADTPRRVIHGTCIRCGALIPVNTPGHPIDDDADTRHQDWHRQLDRLAVAVAEVAP